MFNIIFKSSTSITFELVNNDVYNTKEYDIYLNDELYASNINKNVYSLFNLKPDTTYSLSINGETKVFKTEYENLYLVPGGPTPPNPNELLLGEHISTLFEQLRKEFDYVIDEEKTYCYTTSSSNKIYNLMYTDKYGKHILNKVDKNAKCYLYFKSDNIYKEKLRKR